MRKRKTKRGFVFFEFKDKSGTKCSLQKSSSVEDSIWLGSDKIGLKEFIPYRQPSAWVDMPQFDEPTQPGGIAYIANNRMHLTRKQVKQLLPHLIRFVETGEL